MVAKCLRVSYIPGDFSLVQGIKGGGVSGNTYWKKGKKVTQHGFGYGTAVTPSDLILYAETDGGVISVSIGWFFKNTVGKLTAKRRAAIAASMPKKVSIQSGGRYYTVAESDLFKWKCAAGL